MPTSRCCGRRTQEGGTTPGPREEYADRLADALTAYWSAVLAPLWDRITAIQDADIAHHTQAVAGEGLAAALSGTAP